jgi:hypothetical protein
MLLNYEFGNTLGKNNKMLVPNIPRKQHCLEIIVL